MLTVELLAAFLERIAPLRLAEDWDNVGLLVGDPQGPVRRVMTCLTITPPVAAEAIEQNADLIVAHHHTDEAGSLDGRDYTNTKYTADMTAIVRPKKTGEIMENP